VVSGRGFLLKGAEPAEVVREITTVAESGLVSARSGQRRGTVKLSVPAVP